MDQEIADRFNKLDAELHLLNVKVDAYWGASDRTFRSAQWMMGLSYAMITAATLSILAFIGARAFGWIP